MTTLYDRIKARREELNMSQEDLANKLGYKSRSSINKIEKGENDIPQSKIAAFAKALDTTPGYLMGWDDRKPTLDGLLNIAIRKKIKKEHPNIITLLDDIDPEKLQNYVGSVTGGIQGYTPPDTPRQYPFIPDAVAAGIPCTIEGRNDLPTIGISDALMGKYAGNKHIVIMKVNGDSMNRVIPNGSFVAVKTDVDVTQLKDGDMVVFGKEHEYSLKHYYDAGEKVIFKPNSTNQTFTDHVYSKGENVCIIGKVVMSIRNYN